MVKLDTYLVIDEGIIYVCLPPRYASHLNGNFASKIKDNTTKINIRNCKDGIIPDDPDHNRKVHAYFVIRFKKLERIQAQLLGVTLFIQTYHCIIYSDSLPVTEL